MFQVEYALEAIKQGSAAVGLASKKHVVLVALKRNAEELGSYQKKVLKIDDHLGVALAGLAPDARVLSTYLRSEAMQSKMVFNRPLPTQQAVNGLADKAQSNTQSYGSRPYGVGLLVAGYDQTGTHLFEFQPSGSVLEYVGASIGARSQAARTYLERNLEAITECESHEQLIVHGLNALRDTLAQDVELSLKNTSVAVVGEGVVFTSYDDEAVQQWLDKLDSVTNNRNTALTGNVEDDAPAASEVKEEAETAETVNEGDAAPTVSVAEDTMDTTE